MKINVPVLSALIFLSCNVIRKNSVTYYFVEPFKEYEVKFVLNKDSSFVVEDIDGCNQFSYNGKWRTFKRGSYVYFLLEHVNFNSASSGQDSAFAINNGDTAWVLNNERIFIHSNPFKRTHNKNIDLKKIRRAKLENYYSELFGRKTFIQVFGKGKGLAAARRALLSCSLPDIKIK